MAYSKSPKRRSHIIAPVQQNQHCSNQFMQTRSAELPTLRAAPPVVTSGSATSVRAVQRVTAGTVTTAAPEFSEIPADLARAAFRPDLYALPPAQVQTQGDMSGDSVQDAVAQGASKQPISSRKSVQRSAHNKPRECEQDDCSTTVGEAESDEEAAEIGKEALATLGYEQLIKMAVEAGVLRPQQDAGDSAPVQRQAVESLSFGARLAPWLYAAAATSQIDSPAPGPADLAALGILAIGLVAAGVGVMMASPGNQADSGIMDEARELIATGAATAICAALDILMNAARAAGDKAKMQRIKKTQKAKGCRRSRHS